MKKLILLVSVAVFLLASCKKENNHQITSPLSKNELGVKANIAGVVATRAGAMVDALNQNNDAIGVFITGTGYTPKAAAYTFNSGTSLWVSPSAAADKIFLSNETATVYGFYPADAANSVTLANDATNKIPVTLNPAVALDGTGQIDYMYATTRSGSGPYTYPIATATNGLNANKADLFFHHALSKLSFVVNQDITYTGLGLLTKIQLTSGTPVFPMYSKMLIADGTLSDATPVSALTLQGSAVNINTYNAITPSAVVVAKGLFAPLASTTGITLILTIDGKEMSVALPATAPADMWAVGKNYTYTLTVKGTELIINSVAILPWEEVAGGGADVQ